MKKILFLTAFPPCFKTAGQSYTLNLLKDLSDDYDVDLFYFDYPGHDIDKSLKLNKIIKFKSTKFAILRSLLFPLFSKRLSHSLIDYLQRNSQYYDYIYFDFSQTAGYIQYIKGAKSILMSHDVIGQKYERHRFSILLNRWVKCSEKYLMKKFDAVFTFSNKDSNYIKVNYDIDSIPVPFYLDKRVLDIKIKAIKDYFVMYGAWNRKENQESIDWVLNNISSDHNIKVIGSSLPQRFIERIEAKDNIEYLGFVENPYPVIAESRGLIAPLFHGAGVKVKAIEALALGTPVVGSNITFEGIEEIDYRLGPAMIEVASKRDLEYSIKKLSNLTIQDKEQIREKFLQNYNRRRFKEILDCNEI